MSAFHKNRQSYREGWMHAGTGAIGLNSCNLCQPVLAPRANPECMKLN